jgi:hypothetical protein
MSCFLDQVSLAHKGDFIVTVVDEELSTFLCEFSEELESDLQFSDWI